MTLPVLCGQLFIFFAMADVCVYEKRPRDESWNVTMDHGIEARKVCSDEGGLRLDSASTAAVVHDDNV